MSDTKKIERALVILAQCIDQIEWQTLDPKIKNDPRFRTREQLVRDILSGRQV